MVLIAYRASITDGVRQVAPRRKGQQMSQMSIAVASDHAGYALKCSVVARLCDRGYDVLDLGANSTDSVDYPDYGYALAKAVAEGRAATGIAICGTGIGISIAANRNSEIRAAVCCSTEAAELARAHNDANVLALGARLIAEDEALRILDAFLKTGFEGGRHARRVARLGAPD